MSVKCAICNRHGSDEQPLYCEYCFVFIAQLLDGKYIGSAKLICPSCKFTLNGARMIYCPSCKFSFDPNNPPVPEIGDTEEKNRDQNRIKLARQILTDKSMHDQILGAMGLDRLSRVEQGVALAALSKEKMHNMSSEYNFTEAHTLIDMGYALSKEVGEKWAIDITTMRLGMFYLRSGRDTLASKLLTDLVNNMPNVSQIQQLRKLEAEATLCLSHRLLGNQGIANTLSKSIYKKLESLFKTMNNDINKYLQIDKKSTFIGANDINSSFPRVDLISNVIIILVEEAIVYGTTDHTILSDEVLNRMLEFDNMLDLLTKFTPKDDTGFFASYLRDYVRLFVAIYWYDDVLIKNDDIKRVVLLENAYKRITTWMTLIPTQFWLPLRPSKLIEIFLRVGNWHEKIDGEKIPRFFLNNASEYHIAEFRYAIADAYSKIHSFDQAMEQLDLLLKMDNIENNIREHGERLKWIIRLESNGILMNINSDISSLDFPVTVQVNKLNHHYEPETYMNELLDRSSPVLRLSFEKSKLIENGLAIYGDKLIQIHNKTENSIVSVGNKFYNNIFWEYSKQLVEWGVKDPSDYHIDGVRMDVIIIQSVVRGEPVYLLFQGNQQKISVETTGIRIPPSSLLVLQGIIEHVNMELFELVELLVMIMTGDDDIIDNTLIFTMKSKD